jgi:Zn-dependent protease
MSWWIADLVRDGQVVALASHLFWVIISIVLHELAHGWTALWQGDDTPRRLGHMTPNPLVHMGVWSLVMLLLVGIAWGMMPTDPSRYRSRRRGRFYVAGAGPLMNVLLALLTLTALAAWRQFSAAAPPLHDNVDTFLFIGGWLNTALAIFNMLPVPPLDGANVLAGISFRAYRFYQNPQVAMVGMFIVLVLMVSAIGQMIFFGGSLLAALRYTDAVQALLDGLP